MRYAIRLVLALLVMGSCEASAQAKKKPKKGVDVYYTGLICREASHVELFARLSDIYDWDNSRLINAVNDKARKKACVFERRLVRKPSTLVKKFDSGGYTMWIYRVMTDDGFRHILLYDFNDEVEA